MGSSSLELGDASSTPPSSGTPRRVGPMHTPRGVTYFRGGCYPMDMNTSLQPRILEPTAGSWTLLVGHRRLNPGLLAAIARLGEHTPVRVLDGGNRFNAYVVARVARGRPETLDRITVSRAFTCYQAFSLLKSTPASPYPFIVLDMLNTFYDESVQSAERMRLLKTCIVHLERLQSTSGGVVSVHPPAVPSHEAVEMLELLQASAGECIFAELEPPPPHTLPLF
jgi:hypothetical protein